MGTLCLFVSSLGRNKNKFLFRILASHNNYLTRYDAMRRTGASSKVKVNVSAAALRTESYC